jgi:hypothetical protein
MPQRFRPLAAQSNVHGANQELGRPSRFDPGRCESHLSLSVLQIRNSQPCAAEAAVKKVSELNPTAI